MPLCPKCDEEMVEKKRHSDQSPFWSCLHYPLCSGTRPYLYAAGTSPTPTPRAPVKHVDPVERLCALTHLPPEAFELLTQRECELAGLELLKDRDLFKLDVLLGDAAYRPTKDGLAAKYLYPGNETGIDDALEAFRGTELLP